MKSAKASGPALYAWMGQLLALLACAPAAPFRAAVRHQELRCMTMPPMHSPLTLDPATDLSTQRVRRLSVSEAHQWLQSTQPVLVVDVRERWEFDLGHIAGAKWVPLSAFPKALEDMGLAVDQPILTYCHHGVRSVKAAQIMQQHGMANVASMDGGIDAWAQQVDTQLGRY